MSKQVLALIIVIVAGLLQGCFLTQAPDVDVKRNMRADASSSGGLPTPADLGLSDLNAITAQSGFGATGLVAVDLRPSSGRWVYWTAGSSTMTYNPAPSFVASMGWDMRVTTSFPLVGSNGGDTAREEGFPGANAAFAVGSSQPIDVAALTFNEDRYESLEYEGVKLAPELQNSSVNAIGPGLLRSYSMRDHSVQLSYRVFVLRAADGVSYYAIRFYYYSRPRQMAAFQWRKLL